MGLNRCCSRPSSSTSRSRPIDLPRTSQKIGTHPTINIPPDHPRTDVHSHRVHQSRSILWDMENKRREMLTFEVASFNIGYNCILGRSFLLKFMVVIHTAYATIKMPSPRGVITLKSDQRDALACENATLTHAGR
jgi:hypothetical protein